MCVRACVCVCVCGGVDYFFIVFTKTYKTDRQTERNDKSFKKKLPNSNPHARTHAQTTFIDVMRPETKQNCKYSPQVNNITSEYCPERQDDTALTAYSCNLQQNFTGGRRGSG